MPRHSDIASGADPLVDSRLERQVLFSILFDSEGNDRTALAVRPEIYHDPDSRAIAHAIHEIAEAGIKVTQTRVTHKLSDSRLVKNAELLIQEASRDPDLLIPPADVASGIERLGELYARRCLIDASESMKAEALTMSLSVSDMQANALEAVTKGLVSTQAGTPMSDVVQTLSARFKMDEDILTGKIPDPRVVMSTGHPLLDDKLGGGLSPGRIYAVGARTAVGKTTFMLNIAAELALMGNRRVGYLTYEMNSSELLMRVIAAQAVVSHHDLTAGLIQPGSIEAIERDNVLDALSQSAWEIRERLTMSETIQWIANPDKSQAPEVLFIDYLQIMPYRDGGIREREVAQRVMALKHASQTFQIPIVYGSQLNRNTESRDSDHHPRLSDLRESGAIEQDSDAVLLLHRPWLYDDTEDPAKLVIDVAKNRHGSTGRVEATWDGTMQSVIPIDD